MGTYLQEEYFGNGSIKKLEEIFNQISCQKIFLVTSRNSFEKSGAKQSMKELLRGRNVLRFFDFEPNPKIEDIEKGVKLFKEFSPDLVIAVGGGSVIDMAKSVNILANQEEGCLKDYVVGKKTIKNKGFKLIAIPTTSGSGSEATRFAVVYIGKIKYSLEHDFILPTISIIDPELTLTLTPAITASGGVDALCQAIESYWSVCSTEESKKYAQEAIPLIIENLKVAVSNPTKSTRTSLSWAAHLAGKAINISKTTASHALSYPLTIHFGLSHGLAVGLTIGSILVYNSRVRTTNLNDPRGLEYVHRTIAEVVSFCGAGSPEEAKGKIMELLVDVGLPVSLKDIKISEIEIEELVAESSPERMVNNPCRLDYSDIKRIFLEIT